MLSGISKLGTHQGGGRQKGVKMPTASGVPKRSPIQVLTRPNVA